MVSKSCPAYKRKKSAEIMKAIVKAADRGDCETALRLISTNQAMGASECMRVVGFARVARRVHDCWRRAGRPRARRDVTLGRRAT